jgi:hypothetical protein
MQGRATPLRLSLDAEGISEARVGFALGKFRVELRVESRGSIDRRPGLCVVKPRRFRSRQVRAKG